MSALRVGGLVGECFKSWWVGGLVGWLVGIVLVYYCVIFGRVHQLILMMAFRVDTFVEHHLEYTLPVDSSRLQ